MSTLDTRGALPETNARRAFQFKFALVLNGRDEGSSKETKVEIEAPG
jgi:hypothetical protein